MSGSSGPSNKSGSGKRTATWTSLFQTEEEIFGLENLEMGHYSCTRLLKEMEALESDADEEVSTMARGYNDATPP
jgi:hypothetical protein